MSCRWNGSDQPRVLNGRHVEDCPGHEPDWHPPLVWAECAGCQPCPQGHCGTCARNHVQELTCAECIGLARTNIGEIVRMAAELPDEAAERGTASEAVHLDGPTANPAAWRQRRAYGYRDHIATRKDGTTFRPDVVGETHPLWVLGTWDLLITEHYQHRRTQRVTIPKAAAYLKANLSDLAQDGDFAFSDLAQDLDRCRAHLEAVLHDGEQIEKGAPCLTCRRHMTKTTDPKGKISFTCERCHKDVSENQYRYAVGVAHVAHADRLTAADLADRIGVPASTVRRWVSIRRKVIPAVVIDGELIDGHVEESPPRLRSCGLDTSGRKVYRVTAAETLRDELRGETAAGQVS